jgi:hypothetical protein
MGYILILDMQDSNIRPDSPILIDFVNIGNGIIGTPFTKLREVHSRLRATGKFGAILEKIVTMIEGDGIAAGT